MSDERQPTETTPRKPPRRGDVFWIKSDASRGAIPGHPHPHVVVSDDVFNLSRLEIVIVCAVTSNLRRGSEPGNVQLDAGEANLPKASVIVVSQISSVPKAALGDYIGTLSEQRVERALAGLRFQQAAYFLER